jgi:hypothetical protein
LQGDNLKKKITGGKAKLIAYFAGGKDLLTLFFMGSVMGANVGVELKKLSFLN